MGGGDALPGGREHVHPLALSGLGRHQAPRDQQCDQQAQIAGECRTLRAVMEDPRNPSRANLALVAGLVLVGCGFSPGRTVERERGVIISTHTSGHEWGGDAMGATMDDIRAVGAGWVAIHPYARIDRDGSVRFRDFDPALVRPIREAHARGLKIAIMPHLAYWGSPFSWRGAIAFETDEEWARFFRDYERWVVTLARACREADGFVVGNELGRTVAREAEWRRVIARVREATSARLTYAAKWSDYDRVPFWDALDTIGIQAYFPLSDEPMPSESILAAAWRARMKELRAYSAKHGREIVFTELGYNRSFRAAQAPWDDRSDGPEAERLQELLLRVALRCVEEEACVRGVFLWKWFPNPRPVGRNFQLATPRLKRAISEVWREGPASGR